MRASADKASARLNRTKFAELKFPAYVAYTA